MKGNEKVIHALAEALRSEITAINQYFVHGEMCSNWGYHRLHKAVEKHSIDEMKHAEKLIARILFLEGIPTMEFLHPVNIGATVPEQFKKDAVLERGAVKAYNDFVKVCVAAGDNGSRELFESLVKDEEDHLDWLEAQMDLIDQMGLGQYLSTQVNE